MPERFITTYNSAPALPDREAIERIKEEEGVDLNQYELVQVLHTPNLTESIHFTFYWELV